MEPEPVKRVLVFGKTGVGKSTLCNYLAMGDVEHRPGQPLPFAVGNGLASVTRGVHEDNLGRAGFHVVDTTGLGEFIDPANGIMPQPEDVVCKFLERTAGSYSHILFVREANMAGDAYDLDGVVWQTFLRVFEGAAKAFVVVLTKAHNAEVWFADNHKKLHKKYPQCNNRFICVDFPSDVSGDNEAVTEHKKRMRSKSFMYLTTNLERIWQENDKEFFTPNYAKMKPPEIKIFAKNLVSFLKQYAVRCKVAFEILGKALGIIVPIVVPIVLAAVGVPPLGF